MTKFDEVKDYSKWLITNLIPFYIVSFPEQTIIHMYE